MGKRGPLRIQHAACTRIAYEWRQRFAWWRGPLRAVPFSTGASQPVEVHMCAWTVGERQDLSLEPAAEQAAALHNVEKSYAKSRIWTQFFLVSQASPPVLYLLGQARDRTGSPAQRFTGGPAGTHSPDDPPPCQTLQSLLLEAALKISTTPWLKGFLSLSLVQGWSFHGGWGGDPLRPIRPIAVPPSRQPAAGMPYAQAASPAEKKKSHQGRHPPGAALEGVLYVQYLGRPKKIKRRN